MAAFLMTESAHGRGGKPSREEPLQEKARKPYQSPRLIDYGPVSKLTQGSSTRGHDSTPGALLRRRH